MNRHIASFILFLLSLCPVMDAWAQQSFSARIIDAASKEPLPFAHVYVGEGQGTVTNYEGVFSVMAEPDDVLKISYIGYATQRIRASELPATIRMKALTTQMREVTVLPIQPLLVRASKKLAAEYKQFRNVQSTFFLRMREDYFLDSATWAGHKAQMIEAFLKGYAVGNLRQPVAVTGYRSGWVPEQLWGSGYQWVQTGVMMMGDEIHLVDRIITPLHPKASKKYYDKYYYITYSSFTDEDGQKLMRINFRRYDDVKKPIITGTLIMNHETLEPLSFDGVINNVTFLLNVDEYKALESIRPKIHIEYTHRRGFTEVTNLFARNALSKMDQRYTLVNVGDIELPSGVLVNDNNMWTAIDSAGFDSDFWAQHETVARTADEKALFSLKRTADQDAFGIPPLDFQPDGKKEAREKALKERQRRDSIAMSRLRGVLIIDSLTRKSIPFAEISVKGKGRTMSNLQAFFLADVEPDDTLFIKANGYETKCLAAHEMERIVRLKPWAKDPRKLSVNIEEILTEIGNKIIEEKKLCNDKQDSFFFRRIRIIDRDTMMNEAMIEAASALTVSNPRVIDGQCFLALHNDSISEEDIVSASSVRRDSMLIQMLTNDELTSDEVSKSRNLLRETAGKSFSKMADKSGDFRKPFVPIIGTGRDRHYRRHYNLSAEPLCDSQGHRYLRIRFNKKTNWRYPVIVGTMVIDLDSLHVLSFDGALDGKVAVTSRGHRDHGGVTFRPSASIYYDFRHDHGFTEVWHAGFHTISSLLLRNYAEEWYLLMNCSGQPIPEHQRLNRSVLRMYDEEQLSKHHPLPLDSLIPALITFDIFSEKADWRWIM